MLVAASHISAPPYLAVTVGPSSHSPPPMAEALSTIPGPIIANRSRQLVRGTSINSPVVHRGIACEPGCGATNEAESGIGSAGTGVASCWVIGGEDERERRDRLRRRQEA